MGDCKKIIATAKEISANLKTVSLVAKAPIRRFEVNLKGFGEENIPEPDLFKYNEDNAKSSDTFSKLFEKRIAELSSATEVLRINAAKTLTDLQSASDSLLLVVNWVRSVNDGLQSQFANGDILSASLGKVLLEQALTVDSVAKDLATPFSDSNLTTDIVASTIQSTKQDGFAASDVITFLVDFRPLIQDWVYSTDDVLGSANIDDDQYALFSKVAVDSAAPNDIVLSLVLKGLNDNLASIDAIAKSAGVPLTDFIGVPDALRKALETPKVDAAVMSETCTANLQNYMSALYVSVGYVGVNYAL